MSISSSPLKRVLSGMRPTGKLHLGNYMGALHNWVRLQHEYDCYFFIADWHALTTDYADTSRVKQNTVDVALDFLAAGLDPEKCTIFVQSHVKQHAELHLLLSMITPLGWLERVPTYKEQRENIKGKDLSTYGFLGYPLLQSADILLYQPHFVPVGQDQVAHVELTREVARRFNSLYKSSIFLEPGALLTPSPKLPGTDGRKMSKSYGNTIGLSEPPLIVASKVHSMSTNGQRLRQSDPGDPDVCPVGDLHKVFSTQQVIAETQEGCRTAKMRCEICKTEAGRSVCAVTEPIHDRRQKLEEKIDDTWELLVAQSAKAEKRAEETMLPVRTTFNISHDLGSVRRHFGLSRKEDSELRDLSQHKDWLNLPSDQLGKQMREYWRNNLVPYDVALTQEANRIFPSLEKELEEPFLTARRKRVLVTSAKEEPSVWHFRIPAKSYEVWILLCWRRDCRIFDFVIPQKAYAEFFSKARKMIKKGDSIHLRVYEHQGKWELEFADLLSRHDAGNANVVKPFEPIDVTPFLQNYEPLN